MYSARWKLFLFLPPPSQRLDTITALIQYLCGMRMVYMCIYQTYATSQAEYLIHYNTICICNAQHRAQHMYYTFVLSNIFLSSENEARFVFFSSFFPSLFGVYDVRAKKRNYNKLTSRSIRSNDAKGTKSFDYQVYTIKYIHGNFLSLSMNINTPHA